MERRGFLKTLAAALAVVGVAKATPVESVPVAPVPTMTELSIRHAHERDVWVGRHFDYIVSPEQKRALDALRGQYPVLKPQRYDAAPPLTRRDIDRMRTIFSDRS